MNIIGDNINIVKNIDDCIVLIRDIELLIIKIKISFKFYRNYKKI